MRAELTAWIRSVGLSQFLWRCVRIYIYASAITYALVLLLIAIGPGIPTQPRYLLMLPVLYLSLWLGPIDLMHAYPSTISSGIYFLVIAVVLAAFGFRVRGTPRCTLFLSLSATVWFAASFSIFLSESV